MFCMRADVPLREMFGYAMELRSLTSGEGDFSM
jgi:translation elongation factor EF-G